MWIDTHNAGCRGEGVEVLDEDMFLVHHDPLGAWKSERARQARLDAEAAKNEDSCDE
jgi:hypothetical protein